MDLDLCYVHDWYVCCYWCCFISKYSYVSIVCFINIINVVDVIFDKCCCMMLMLMLLLMLLLMLFCFKIFLLVYYCLCFNILFHNVWTFCLFWLVGRDSYLNNEDEAKMSIVTLCERSGMKFIAALTLTLSSFHWGCHYERQVCFWNIL